MESLASYFMLFLAGISALITYLIVPRLPAVALGSIAALALIAGVWWHWNQFATEYRTSTWQEYLRSWGSYVMVFAAIFLSYGVYAVTAGGSSSSSVVTRESSQNQSQSPILSNLTETVGDMFNMGAPETTPAPNIVPTPAPIIPSAILPGGINLNLGLGGNTGEKEPSIMNLPKKNGNVGRNGNMNRNRPVNGVNFLT